MLSSSTPLYLLNFAVPALISLGLAILSGVSVSAAVSRAPRHVPWLILTTISWVLAFIGGLVQIGYMSQIQREGSTALHTYQWLIMIGSGFSYLHQFLLLIAAIVLLTTLFSEQPAARPPDR